MFSGIMTLKKAVELEASRQNRRFQLLMFSATFSKEAQGLAANFAPKARVHFEETDQERHPVDNVQIFVLKCKNDEKKLQVHSSSSSSWQSFQDALILGKDLFLLM
jgi:superfamily II DNA/RNA helicase